MWRTVWRMRVFPSMACSGVRGYPYRWERQLWLPPDFFNRQPHKSIIFRRPFHLMRTRRLKVTSWALRILLVHNLLVAGIAPHRVPLLRQPILPSIFPLPRWTTTSMSLQCRPIIISESTTVQCNLRLSPFRIPIKAWWDRVRSFETFETRHEVTLPSRSTPCDSRQFNGLHPVLQPFSIPCYPLTLVLTSINQDLSANIPLHFILVREQTVSPNFQFELGRTFPNRPPPMSLTDLIRWFPQCRSMRHFKESSLLLPRVRRLFLFLVLLLHQSHPTMISLLNSVFCPSIPRTVQRNRRLSLRGFSKKLTVSSTTWLPRSHRRRNLSIPLPPSSRMRYGNIIWPVLQSGVSPSGLTLVRPSLVFYC